MLTGPLGVTNLQGIINRLSTQLYMDLKMVSHNCFAFFMLTAIHLLAPFTLQISPLWENKGLFYQIDR